MNGGFIQLRRGLYEHVKDGRLSFFEVSLYVAILSDTNPSTGLCFGSAGLFAALYNVSSRTCRDALEKLEEKGYLRRFPIRGKHGSYPILVNKFKCSSGAMKGKYVNCSKSSSYVDIIYDICNDGVDDSAVAGVNEDVDESAARVDTREEKLDKEPELTLLSPTAPKKEIRPEEFANVWNRLRGKLPKVERFTESRKKKVKTRMNEGLTLERFAEAVENCTTKPFLRGDNNDGWTATFDWLVENDKNIEKAINNPYGLNKPNGGNHATVPNGTGNQIVGVLQKTLAGRQRNRTFSEDGDLPSSGEVGRNDIEPVHGISSQPRLASVSGSDEEYLKF